MANLVAMLRLPGNLKSTQWQILAGPILILLILSMMVLPLPAFILVHYGFAGGDVHPAHP